MIDTAFFSDDPVLLAKADTSLFEPVFQASALEAARVEITGTFGIELQVRNDREEITEAHFRKRIVLSMEKALQRTEGPAQSRIIVKSGSIKNILMLQKILVEYFTGDGSANMKHLKDQPARILELTAELENEREALERLAAAVWKNITHAREILVAITLDRYRRPAKVYECAKILDEIESQLNMLLSSADTILKKAFGAVDVRRVGKALSAKIEPIREETILLGLRLRQTGTERNGMTGLS